MLSTCVRRAERKTEGEGEREKGKTIRTVREVAAKKLMALPKFTLSFFNSQNLKKVSSWHFRKDKSARLDKV